jgi:hypothetical protein
MAVNQTNPDSTNRFFHEISRNDQEVTLWDIMWRKSRRWVFKISTCDCVFGKSHFEHSRIIGKKVQIPKWGIFIEEYSRNWWAC